jgi:hypothetical protein
MSSFKMLHMRGHLSFEKSGTGKDVMPSDGFDAIVATKHQFVAVSTALRSTVKNLAKLQDMDSEIKQANRNRCSCYHNADHRLILICLEPMVATSSASVDLGDAIAGACGISLLSASG